MKNLLVHRQTSFSFDQPRVRSGSAARTQLVKAVGAKGPSSGKLSLISRTNQDSQNLRPRLGHHDPTQVERVIFNGGFRDAATPLHFNSEKFTRHYGRSIQREPFYTRRKSSCCEAKSASSPIQCSGPGTGGLRLGRVEINGRHRLMVAQLLTYWSDSNVCFPRLTAARTRFGSAIHTKGLGSALVSATKRLIATCINDLQL
jgi:hypothetical protein